MTATQMKRQATALRKQAERMDAAGLAGLAKAYRDLATAVEAEALGRD